MKNYHVNGARIPGQLKKNNKNGRFEDLIVFSPGMVALGAPEKPHLALICGTQLAEPPDCFVVLALGTFCRDGGQRPHLLLILDDYHLLFTPLFGLSHLIGAIYLPDIPASSAFKLAGRGDHEAFAFWAEHCFSYACATEINAWLGQKKGKKERFRGRPGCRMGILFDHSVLTLGNGRIPGPFLGHIFYRISSPGKGQEVLRDAGVDRNGPLPLRGDPLLFLHQ